MLNHRIYAKKPHQTYLEHSLFGDASHFSLAYSPKTIYREIILYSKLPYLSFSTSKIDTRPPKTFFQIEDVSLISQRIFTSYISYYCNINEREEVFFSNNL
jgi:hypothetical protein